MKTPADEYRLGLQMRHEAAWHRKAASIVKPIELFYALAIGALAFSLMLRVFGG